MDFIFLQAAAGEMTYLTGSFGVFSGAGGGFGAGP